MIQEERKLFYMGSEERKMSRMTPKFLTSVLSQIMEIFTKIGNAGRQQICKKLHEFILGNVKLEGLLSHLRVLSREYEFSKRYKT